MYSTGYVVIYKICRQEIRQLLLMFKRKSIQSMRVCAVSL